jgi:TPR repeat protein
LGKIMRNTVRLAALAGLVLAAIATPAQADVKAGVDAWSRGEYKKAVDIWRTDANAGDADAQFDMGQAYRLGRGVPVDLPVAAEWFRKAAVQGHVEAITNYGLTLFDEGKHGEAVPWLEKSVARGEPRAQMTLGTMLYNGDGVDQDFPRAYALLVRSTASGLPRAAEVQAQMDQYIPLPDRQKGLELAKRYEAQAQRPELPPEIAGRGTEQAMQATELPPSSYDPNAASQPSLKPARPTRGTVVTQVPPITRQPVATAAVETRPVEARPVRPVAAASGGAWRLQLGAFGDPANARKLWGQIGGRFPGRQPFYVKSGSLTRMLVGPFGSKGEAAAACGSLRPCVPMDD